MEKLRRIRQQMRMGLRRGILCFGAIAITAAAVAASDSLQEIRKRQANGPLVRIYTHTDTTMPLSVLGRAELTATSIFAGIGVPVVWRSGSKHTLGAEGELSIEMRLNTRLPAEFHPGALAYAEPYGTSDGEAGDLLGYVMAHEITHLLQGVDRHSAEGIMKARWDKHDRREMIFRRLPFAAIDTVLIHAGLGNQR